MACDPNTLLEQAKCVLKCATPGMFPAMEIAALCNLTNQSLTGLQVGTDVVNSATFVVSPDAAAPVIITRHAADNAPAILRIQKKGTTGNINGAVSNNDNLARLDFYGWDGSDFFPGSVFQLTANESWNGAAHGSRLTFNVVANGAVVTTEMLRLTATMADLRGTAVLGVNGTQVVSARNTGWATFGAGASNKNAAGLDTATVTTAQLAQIVKALMDAFITHGLIGA